jgi:hypothetical protein
MWLNSRFYLSSDPTSGSPIVRVIRVIRVVSVIKVIRVTHHTQL